MVFLGSAGFVFLPIAFLQLDGLGMMPTRLIVCFDTEYSSFFLYCKATYLIPEQLHKIIRAVSDLRVV